MSRRSSGGSVCPSPRRTAPTPSRRRYWRSTGDPRRAGTLGLLRLGQGGHHAGGRARSKRIGQRPADELSETHRSADPFVSIDVSDALERLPDYHRQVLVLRGYYGMDEQEMAAILELPVGTVRSRLFRARRNFQNAWHQRSA
ncbi:sigma factor-like helix-turn-helix DNA-binding protein [Streptomyces sp. M19]